MSDQPPAEQSAECSFEAVLDFAIAEGENFDVIITPKPGTRVARMDSKTTRALRDLVGATFDMKRVVELCREYVVALGNGSPQVVQDALWMTAVVLYARCFNGGVRQPLKTSVLDSIPGQAKEAHDHFIDLRDKFIAHSVSVYEQTLPYVVVGLENKDVLSTGTTHLWANPMNEEGARTLEGLASAFYTWGSEQRAVIGMLVRMEAEALDSSSLARLPDLAVDTPNVQKAGHRRKP